MSCYSSRPCQCVQCMTFNFRLNEDLCSDNINGGAYIPMCTLCFFSNRYRCCAMSIIVTGCFGPKRQDHTSLLTSTRCAKVVTGTNASGKCAWPMWMSHQCLQLVVANSMVLSACTILQFTGCKMCKQSNNLSLRFHMELLVRVIKTTVNINCVNLNGALSL